MLSLSSMETFACRSGCAQRSLGARVPWVASPSLLYFYALSMYTDSRELALCQGSDSSGLAASE